jgi:hypothetical protein
MLLVLSASRNGNRLGSTKLDAERMRNRRFPWGTLELALKVFTKLEKNNYMEIITASVGISFALFLAALAVTPTLIGVYLELQAQKRHGEQQNASEFPAAYPPPVPFNYPQIFLREMPRKTDRPGITERHGAQQNASELLAVYPPPVPFNAQITWRSVRGVVKHR